jgi:hypothetical protein
VINSITAYIRQFKHCNSLVHFFLSGTNVFTLDSNEHYFRSQNCALQQDLHSLQGSTCDPRAVHALINLQITLITKITNATHQRTLTLHYVCVDVSLD